MRMTAIPKPPRPAKARAVRFGASVIRIGYVPLIDAAPLLMADALGLFQDAGLQVRLDRELGWGSIREKVVYGELDAAHAPGGLLFSVLCGTHSRPRPVSTDLVLNLQGNAITLSRRLWAKGVRDAATLRQLLRSEAPRKPVFAVVSPFASHGYLLCKWLRSAGIDPERDVRITVLPPALVGEHMKEGHIDGFCVGEPWNSASTLAGDGWIAATSASLERSHPEKVLLAGDDLRQRRHEEYLLLRDAVLKACRHCDTPEGRAEVVELLHERRLFPVGREVIANSLIGPFQKGAGQPPDATAFLVFSRNQANRATRERAVWLLDALAVPSGVALDAAQRRACLDAFHDIDLPSPALKAGRSPKKKPRHSVTAANPSEK